VVSASYDTTVRCWPLDGGGASARSEAAAYCVAVLALPLRNGPRRGIDSRFWRRAACLRGHGAPVMDVCWGSDGVLSGDRGGLALLWDLGAGGAERFRMEVARPFLSVGPGAFLSVERSRME
jgi:WD40 repeat protein